MASPPYPAEHSQRPVSVFISAFTPHTQESELVASVSPSSMLDPAGQDVHCVLPILDLYDVVPQAMQPTFGFVASPPYPAWHSQRPVPVFNSAFRPHKHESELVASVSPSSMLDPAGQDVHCVLPILDLYDVVPQAMQPTFGFVASPPYPAWHSQRPVPVFNSAFRPHKHEAELVASVSPSAMLDPAGQDVHCVFPTFGLNAVVPQTLHPTLAFVASPPCPARHSQM